MIGSYDDLTFLEQSKCWHWWQPARAALERRAWRAGEISLWTLILLWGYRRFRRLPKP